MRKSTGIHTRQIVLTYNKVHYFVAIYCKECRVEETVDFEISFSRYFNGRCLYRGYRRIVSGQSFVFYANRDIK
jgi:hypothetical protein